MARHIEIANALNIKVYFCDPHSPWQPPGKENTYGTIVGRLAESPLTYLRVSTDDSAGKVRAYIGEGELTNDPLKTFGGYGVVKIRDFQKLLRYICENGFEHHVAVNPTRIAAGTHEALSKYLGWEVYRHE